MTSREEVAKKLREAGKELDNTFDESDDGDEFLAAFIATDLAIGQPKRSPFEFSPFFNRLADLIDPTCENKQIETNKMAPIEFKTDNFICSNCGEIFCADKEGFNAPIDWSYCPACGARVVRDE